MPTQPGSAPVRDRYHHGDLANALLEAVEGIIVEKGVAGVTLREAARRAGVSHSAPAHHFGDKQGMLAAFARQGFLMLGEALSASTPDGPEEAMQVGKSYVRFAAEHPAHFDIMFRWSHDHDAHPELEAAARATFGIAETMAASLVEAGVFRDVEPKALAAYLWALVHGIATLWVDGSLAHEYSPYDFDETVDAILRAAYSYRPPA
jgi:AcrR family transcriptional regulator